MRGQPARLVRQAIRVRDDKHGLAPACAPSDHVSVAPPTRLMNLRRLIAPPRAEERHRSGSNWEIGSG